MKNLFRNSKKGFTLVEVIIVLVILAILATVLIPSLSGYIDSANEKALVTCGRSFLMASQTRVSERYAEKEEMVFSKTDYDLFLDLAELTNKFTVDSFTLMEGNASKVYEFYITEVMAGGKTVHYNADGGLKYDCYEILEGMSPTIPDIGNGPATFDSFDEFMLNNGTSESTNKTIEHIMKTSKNLTSEKGSSNDGQSMRFYQDVAKMLGTTKFTYVMKTNSAGQQCFYLTTEDSYTTAGLKASGDQTVKTYCYVMTETNGKVSFVKKEGTAVFGYEKGNSFTVKHFVEG